MILIFDTETTGLPLHPAAPLDKQPKIIEFGCVMLSPEDGEVVETHNFLINPRQLLDPVITKITGLVDADLVDQPIFAQVLPQIQEIFARSTAAVAHNLPFDKSLMRFELARMRIQLSHDSDPIAPADPAAKKFPWPAKEMCTVGAFQEVWGRRPKLIELYEWSLRRPLAQTHRASDDAAALAEIVREEELWRDLQ